MIKSNYKVQIVFKMEVIMETIFKRKSVRTFLDKKVEKEKIDQILKAAMAAPSAKNEQPWEFYVV